MQNPTIWLMSELGRAGRAAADRSAQVADMLMRAKTLSTEREKERLFREGEAAKNRQLNIESGQRAERRLAMAEEEERMRRKLGEGLRGLARDEVGRYGAAGRAVGEVAPAAGMLAQGLGGGGIPIPVAMPEHYEAAAVTSPGAREARLAETLAAYDPRSAATVLGRGLSRDVERERALEGERRTAAALEAYYGGGGGSASYSGILSDPNLTPNAKIQLLEREKEEREETKANELTRLARETFNSQLQSGLTPAEAYRAVSADERFTELPLDRLKEIRYGGTISSGRGDIPSRQRYAMDTARISMKDKLLYPGDPGYAEEYMKAYEEHGRLYDQLVGGGYEGPRAPGEEPLPPTKPPLPGREMRSSEWEKAGRPPNVILTLERDMVIGGQSLKKGQRVIVRDKRGVRDGMPDTGRPSYGGALTPPSQP